jgi:hypothetical protein
MACANPEGFLVSVPLSIDHRHRPLLIITLIPVAVPLMPASDPYFQTDKRFDHHERRYGEIEEHSEGGQEHTDSS